MSSFQKILYAVDAHGVARITLNRPDKRNALDGELMHEIKDAVQACADDDTVRAIVLAGAGADRNAICDALLAHGANPLLVAAFRARRPAQRASAA